MHALGSAATPLVARPFIASSSCRESSSRPAELEAVSTVNSVYALVGAFDLVVAFICVITSCLFPSDVVPLMEASPHQPEGATSVSFTATDTEAGSPRDEILAASRVKSSILLLLVMSLFFTVNGGRDALLNTLLFTYVDKYLNWTLSSAVALVTSYHVTRAIVRAILVPVSGAVSPPRLMMFDVMMLTVSSSLMLVGADVLTAAGVVVTAMATSNLHATAVSLIETHHLIAPVMAVFISAIGAGQMIMAPLTGRLLETAGASSFPAMLLALALAGLALFCVYCFLNYNEPVLSSANSKSESEI